MPTPPQVPHAQKSTDGDEEDEIPHVEFGVTEVEVVPSGDGGK
jgi:hypothetical protein